MKGTTHLSFGLSTGVATALMLDNYISIEQQVPFIVACTLGSILVDIDNKESIIGRDLRPISTTIQKIFGHRNLIHSPIFWIILYFLFNTIINFTGNYAIQRNNTIFIITAILCMLSFISNLKDTHKLIKCLFLYLFLPMACCYICMQELSFALYGLMLGVAGHLLLDMMTRGGVPLLYPIRWKNKNKEIHIKKFRILPLKSGVWFETFIALIIFIGFYFLLSEYVVQISIQNCYNPFIIFKNVFVEFIKTKF